MHSAQVKEMRLEGEGCLDSALLAQLRGRWVVVRGQGLTAVVQLLNLVLLPSWRCKNHALNAGAGAQWFQVTYFPPTPVLMKKKLWSLTWTRFVCSLAVAGVFLNPTLSFAVLLFLGEQWRCCCSFCCPRGLWASRAAAAPSPCSSGGT